MNNQLCQIKREVQGRGITRLCHFTQSRKLAHILGGASGILSTKRLSVEAPDLMDVTDSIRLDGYNDHVCCSIEFPNTWYFNKIKGQDPLFKDWVIIFIKPSVLWRAGTKFSPRNAAAGFGKLVSSGFPKFMSMYGSSVTGAYGVTRSRTNNMLAACPTDDQAEVLVPSYIPKDDIIGVAVQTKEQAQREIDRLSFVGEIPDIEWVISPELFRTRWSQLVRSGRRPAEEKYI